MQPCILQVGVSTVALQLPIRTQPKSAAKIAVRIKPRFMRFLLCFLFHYNIKAEYCQDTFAIFFLGKKQNGKILKIYIKPTKNACIF